MKVVSLLTAPAALKRILARRGLPASRITRQVFLCTEEPKQKREVYRQMQSEQITDVRGENSASFLFKREHDHAEANNQN